MISFMIFTQSSSNVRTYTSGIYKVMGKLSEPIKYTGMHESSVPYDRNVNKVDKVS